MRPAVFQVGGTLYWTILTRDPDTLVAKDADSTPSVAVTRNNTPSGDSVTITKRSATTGIYDCSYNPAAEAEGETFHFLETATVTGTTTSSATYPFGWVARCVAVERGTDSANTTTPPTAGSIADAVWDEARTDHDTAGTFGEKVNAELDTGTLAILNDIPTTAEFEARTIAAANYATASQINSLQVNTRASVQVPVEIETPDSGSQVWKIRLFLFDVQGNMEAPDSTPTIALVNAAGDDRSSRLSSATTLSTGAYAWDYTATDDDAEEQLNWTFTVVEGGLTRIYPATSYVVEETAYRFTSTDRATLNSRASQTSVDDLPTNSELATALSGKATTSDVTTVGSAVAAVSTKLGTPAGASVSADIASVKTDTGTTIPGLFTTLTTKIRKFFQLSLRKDAAIATDNATELTELNASGGSGVGAYSNITDAQESIRDRGDAAWSGGGGGGGSDPALLISTTIESVTSPTVIVLTEGTAENNAYVGKLVVITDAETANQKASVLASGYVGSSRTLTLEAAPTFTVAAGDAVSIIAVSSLTLAQQAQLTSIKNSTDQITGAPIEWVGSVRDGGEIQLTVGDDHISLIDHSVDIPVSDPGGTLYGKFTADGVTVQWGAGQELIGGKILGTVTDINYASNITTVTVEIEACKPTGNIRLPYKYQIQRTLSGKKATLVEGTLTVRADMIETH